MPGRDGTGPIGRKNMGCRRGNGGGGMSRGFRSDPYCRRFEETEGDAEVLKEQAQYYETQLKRVNSQLNDLKNQNEMSEIGEA